MYPELQHNLDPSELKDYRPISKLPFLSKILEKVVFNQPIKKKITILYFGITQSCLSRLQLVQKAAAGVLTRSEKREHITSILASLHWLPVGYTELILKS